MLVNTRHEKRGETQRQSINKIPFKARQDKTRENARQKRISVPVIHWSLHLFSLGRQDKDKTRQDKKNTT